MNPLLAPATFRRPARIAAWVGLGLAGAAGAQPSWRDSAIVQACGAEVRQHCRTPEPGAGRWEACLQPHDAEPGAACRALWPQAVQCHRQVQEVCGGASRERTRACVASKRDDLASACGFGAAAN